MRTGERGQDDGPRRVGPDGRGGRDARATRCALAAAAGDRAALAEFIALTQDDVWRFVAHRAGAAAADDLTQDTYLRAMDALPGFEGRATARSWLLAIARNVCVDAVRREVARPQVPCAPDELASHARSSGGGQEVVDATSLLDGLDEERREAFVLTQVLGFSYQEAAVVCGVRIGTIRSRVARARTELVAAMADDEQLPGARPA